MTPLFGRALCALALLSTAQAHAAITATAQLDGFAVELVDLEPGDGIAPTLTLVGGRSVLIGTAFNHGGPSPSATLWGEGPFADLAASFEQGTVRSAASISGGALGPPWASARLRAEGALGDATSPLREFTAGVSSNGEIYEVVTLLLSPYSSVMITAQAALTLSKTVAPDLTGLSGESALANAGLYMFAPGGLENGLNAQLHIGLFDDAQSLERTATLQAWAVNNTSQPMALHFQASASVDGRSVASVVPEPSTWALFGAGLGALAWLARRRPRVGLVTA